MTSSSETCTPEQPARSWRRLRRYTLQLLALVLTLVLATSALLAWFTVTDSGSQQAWRIAVWALRGKLAGDYVGGNLAQGLQLRQLRYHDGALQVDIDKVDARWQLSLRTRTFSVRALHLGNLNIRLPAASESPTVLPDSLRLPLALNLKDLGWQHFRLEQDGSVTSLGVLRAHGSSDGTQHTLTVGQLDTGFGLASGTIKLNGTAPFATSGTVLLTNLQGDPAQTALPEKFQLAAQLSGSLQQLGIAINASGDKLQGSATLLATPFAAIPLQQAEIALQHINPQAFHPDAPVADLNVAVQLHPVEKVTPLHLAGGIAVTNASPGRLDQQRLPVRALRANVQLELARQEINDLQITLLERAVLSGSGHFVTETRKGALNLQVSELDLHALYQQLQPTQLRGPLAVTVEGQQVGVDLQLKDNRYAVTLKGAVTPELVTLNTLNLAASGAKLTLTGTIGTANAMDTRLTGELRNLDPSAWIRNPAAAARINMQFTASGMLAPQVQGKLSFQMRNSTYQALPMSGSGTLALMGTTLLPSQVDLQIAGNHLQLQGAFGAPADRLNIHLDAPLLAQLGIGVGGAVKFDGQLSGSMQRPGLQANFNASGLTWGPHRVARLSGQTTIQSNLDSGLTAADNKLAFSLEGENYRGPDTEIKQLKAILSGTYGAHQFSLQADGKLHGQTLALAFDAHGKLAQERLGLAWSGMIDKLVNRGSPALALAAPMPLSIAPDTLIAGPARVTMDSTLITLNSLRYQQGRLQSEGSANHIDVGRILTLAQQLTGTSLSLRSDLILDSKWDFALAENTRGFIDLERRSGDLWLDNGSNSTRITGNGDANAAVTLGLSRLSLRLDLAGPEARLQGQVQASRIGAIDLSGTIGLLHQNGVLMPAAASALSLNAVLRVPQLRAIGAMLGPQYGLEGNVTVQLGARGSLGVPRLSGTIEGNQLALILFDEGIQLKDGIVRISMDDDIIDLRRIEFHGSSGTLTANGKVRLGADDPDLQANIVADRLQLLASPDRQLMLSGQARVANVNEQLRIDGKFVVDKALFDLPKSSAPKLSDDVVIVRRDNNRRGANSGPRSDKSLTAVGEKRAGNLVPFITIQVDLGNNFHFSGSGANLRLSGDMTIHSEPKKALSATGTIHVAEGTYEAFGTKLNIERGIINFQGPLSNPNLNILAMRRNQDVEAGVEVTGLVSQPRIRLVSEPNVADDEKLSWLMFGNSSDSSGLGQRSASSQALALLGNYGGKKIAQGIGIDNLSIGTSESGLGNDQVVSLGKAITDRLSVGYEQSLTGAASIAKLTWQLSKRWSAVVRTGTINGINFVYNLRFD
ncbi:translocation and assembly module TamB [Herbaspirillum sp. Sphag1AN]|uniref:translocation/assembly module TamB domain-containing protein n=1 Tax=unclassified Herbaspirillum TaxID=2624150 RepID=UPI001609C3B6|nr:MULTISPECIES: translocation/assembly module TamB domain-containing protein [unclassified Herbaspirillum]MBB3210816.1 translocation and assembly module TamB [Herbaspirillum sp. Sphag1AN]MBB3244446.1 translocation and assembly module TamB [Herbaspirillum sp. Sphag64]